MHKQSVHGCLYEARRYSRSVQIRSSSRNLYFYIYFHELWLSSWGHVRTHDIPLRYFGVSSKPCTRRPLQNDLWIFQITWTNVTANRITNLHILWCRRKQTCDLPFYRAFMTALHNIVKGQFSMFQIKHCLYFSYCGICPRAFLPGRKFYPQLSFRHLLLMMQQCKVT